MESQKLLKVLERIAMALEQISLDMDERSLPALAETPASKHDPTQTVIPLKQEVAHIAQTQARDWLCPEHHTPAKTVPAGVSRTTGKSYEAFQVCSTAFCKQKPQAMNRLP